MLRRRIGERPAPAPERAAARRCLLFTVGATPYAIEMARIRHSLPAAGHGAEVRVHGLVYPVVDGRALFDLPPAAAGERMILALEATAGRLGLIIDRVTRLAAIEAAAIVPVPPVFTGLERGWLEGLVRVDADIVALLRVEALLEHACRRAGESRSALACA